jgi:hypothetical protein
MLDRQKVETILIRRFPGASREQVAISANAIMGLAEEWEEVGSHDFLALAVQRAEGAEFRVLRRRPCERPASSCQLCRLNRRIAGDGSSEDWQQQRDDGAAGRRRVDLDLTAVSIDDPLGERQPEAGAAALRREERLERVLTHLGGHARARIRN